ncbi:TIGR02300 family protein [Sphingomonas sp. AP4-R1]|uniref:TIGR02300 family protein n=1 Tax=Sphingomonas sp. AP4-R1 TaxID=2735134 RepID=UPI001493A81A|nr:TIGR02300 family protein [Sphingomonas sp. AP4-R1]QJU59036.1 TIGR02300 family protein [Sphingomonas sp. AP4-R1]
MVKPEWGAKRTCPKCGTRFYDLGKDDPVVCVECGTNFEPELILKSKQPLPFDAPKPSQAKKESDDDLDENLDVDEDEEPSADDDVDLGGDDDIGVDTASEDEDQ